MSTNSYAVKKERYNKEKSLHSGSAAGLRTAESDRVRRITMIGILMGMNVALCAFGVPVPGGHLYLNDVVICTAALLMDAPAAFLIGGVGAMVGDMIFYPVAMFVSLFAHGLQAAAISLIYHRLSGRHHAAGSGTGTSVSGRSVSGSSGIGRKAAAIAATLVGAVIMVTGYTLGKIYVYSTFEYAMIKLPYEIAQALLGVVVSVSLCFRGRLMEYYERFR